MRKNNLKALTTLLLTLLLSTSVFLLGAFASDDFDEQLQSVLDASGGEILQNTQDDTRYRHDDYGHLALVDTQDNEKFLIVEDGSSVGAEGSVVLRLPGDTNPGCVNALPKLAELYMEKSKDLNEQVYDKTQQAVDLEIDIDLDVDIDALNEEERKELEEELAENNLVINAEGEIEVEGFIYRDPSKDISAPREIRDEEIDIEIIMDVEAEEVIVRGNDLDEEITNELEDFLLEMEIEFEFDAESNELTINSDEIDEDTMIELNALLEAHETDIIDEMGDDALISNDDDMENLEPPIHEIEDDDEVRNLPQDVNLDT